MPLIINRSARSSISCFPIRDIIFSAEGQEKVEAIWIKDAVKTTIKIESNKCLNRKL